MKFFISGIDHWRIRSFFFHSFFFLFLPPLPRTSMGRSGGGSQMRLLPLGVMLLIGFTAFYYIEVGVTSVCAGDVIVICCDMSL